MHYKTCRLRRFLEQFSQIRLQKYQKALGFPLKVDDVSRPRKTVKCQCSLLVLAHAAKVIKNLIKPVVSWCFFGHWRKKGAKTPYKTWRISTNYQKRIRLSLKVDDVSRPRKTVRFKCSLRVLAHAGKVIKIHYKTCRFLSLFGHWRQKGAKNPYQTCRILTKKRVCKNKKRKIPVALRSFCSTRFSCKKPL